MKKETLIRLFEQQEKIISSTMDFLAEKSPEDYTKDNANAAIVMAGAYEVLRWEDDPREEEENQQVKLHPERAKVIVDQLREQAKKLPLESRADALELVHEVAEEFDLENVCDSIRDEIRVLEASASPEIIVDKQEEESEESFLKRVEARAKELFEMSEQGSWDDLDTALQTVWINSARSELEGND